MLRIKTESSIKQKTLVIVYLNQALKVMKSDCSVAKRAFHYTQNVIF